MKFCVLALLQLQNSQKTNVPFFVTSVVLKEVKKVNVLEQAALGLSTEWHERHNPAEIFQRDINNFSAFIALYKSPLFLCAISMSFLGDGFNIRLA